MQTVLMSFFGWWQFVDCLFGFAALMAVRWHIGRKQNDFGQVWLALPQELEYIEKYILLQKIRNAVDIDIRIDEEAIKFRCRNEFESGG